MRTLRFLTGVTALALALPGLAHASTVTRNASLITYQSSGGSSDTVNLGTDGANVFVTSELGVTSNDCGQVDPNRVDCPFTPAFLLNFTSTNDSLATDQLTGSSTIEAHGGAGGDSLAGGPNADKLFGDDGDDRLEGNAGNDALDGAGGSDALYDGAGDDSATGGPGDDILYPGTGRDTFAGGDGGDRADYNARSAPVTITLDGQADDGEAGEGDNIGTDVEYAYGGGGNDRIVLGATEGGASGNGGNDTITGGPGDDRIEGNEGNDMIDARDGHYDSIDCGPGNDTVLADPGDGVSNCEIAPDRDGDGTPNEQDCAPDDPAVHPGAGEVLGNAIDEDCVGGPGYLRVDAGVIFKITKKKAPLSIRFSKLRATALDEGDKIEVRCRGKGCPFKKVTRNVPSSTQSVNLTGLFKKRFLRKGVVVEVRITHDQQIGIVRVLTVAKGPRVKEVRRCLLVGSTTPTSCPAT